MSDPSPCLSFVVPVYREEKNIPEFLQRLTATLQPITDRFEIIFALDPSPDLTEDVILAARSHDARIKLLKFSRRFGQPMATLAGLEYASGDAVIVMDVDMQDPPDLIGEMVAKWREGYDVVLPQRRQRTGEPWLKKLVSATGYKVINKIADVRIPIIATEKPSCLPSSAICVCSSPTPINRNTVLDSSGVVVRMLLNMREARDGTRRAPGGTGAESAG